MTVKERIHLLVEELDEQQAEAALVLLDRFLTTKTGHGGVALDEAEGPSRATRPGTF
ncbi:MAG: hypothetical protein QOF73_2869 [Thermomicrobiales bacterium]|nr:hypothetical protein [Thermomicrobiales bacterium]